MSNNNNNVLLQLVSCAIYEINFISEILQYEYYYEQYKNDTTTTSNDDEPQQYNNNNNNNNNRRVIVVVVDTLKKHLEELLYALTCACANFPDSGGDGADMSILIAYMSRVRHFTLELLLFLKNHYYYYRGNDKSISRNEYSLDAAECGVGVGVVALIELTYLIEDLLSDPLFLIGASQIMELQKIRSGDVPSLMDYYEEEDDDNSSIDAFVDDERRRVGVSLWNARADSAIGVIAAAANAIESGLQKSVPVISNQFDSAANLAKSKIKPIPKDLQPIVPKELIKASSTARDITSTTHSTSKEVFLGVGKAATYAANGIVKEVDNHVTKTAEPKINEKKELAAAAGKVALATFGAAATISEALIETTIAVSHKAAHAAADVVSHRYGEESGIVVKNGADVVKDSMRTLTFLTSLSKFKTVAKGVAKNNGKTIYKNKNDKHQEGGIHANDNDTVLCSAEESTLPEEMKV